MMDFTNTLAGSKSSYLREAAQQPVHWQEFSEEAFKIAKKLDRPILLDIGAVWCHWCHVMDEESYSDATVAEVINEYFVPIKVDRDQMPDVDSRYQNAVGAITGTGGWPLTAFLTPDGKVFFGGTYFPKDDIDGRPGLLTLLPRIAEAYSSRRDEISKNAEELFLALKEYGRQNAQKGELSDEIIADVLKDAHLKFDKDFGGFGTTPKFFNATVLHLIAEEIPQKDDGGLREMLDRSLDFISRGGIRDHIGGGFHRYSVDRFWHVPHFEKMLYDNALMLKSYLLGYQVLHKKIYADIARETAEWIVNVMQSPEGPFYAHQDADVGRKDDGTYWTWSKKEIEALLTEEERQVLELYFDIRQFAWDIRDFPEKNVLRVVLDEENTARRLGKNSIEVFHLLATAKKKLFEARGRRKTPFIDKTIFADRNGLTISALVEAALVLQEQKYFQAAAKAADFILDAMIDSEGVVAHAFSDNVTIYHGLLDDNVFFGIALLDLFDVTRRDLYLNSAERIARSLLAEFEDKDEGGFFDRRSILRNESFIGLQKKPIEDVPTPSGNSGAAIFFDRLFSITENKEYFFVADRTLRSFASSVGKMGIYAANYARALRFHLFLEANLK
jgi:uncharacterized protein YyaL (SSP411 family)